jgi:parallel beta-helix repeat protein
MFNSSANEGVITLTGRRGCKIANLQVDGNKTSYTGGSNFGIYLDASSNNNTVTGNTCNNNTYGIYLEFSSNNTIIGNTCNNNTYGIYLGESSDNTIIGNTCNNNTYGIYLGESSDNAVTGNTCSNNEDFGIYLFFSSNNNTVTGNTCNNNNSGICLEDSSNNNAITGNTCIRGNGLATNYTASQHTIWLIKLFSPSNNYNLIAMNNCMGKAVTNEGGTGNTLVNNKFDAT